MYLNRSLQACLCALVCVMVSQAAFAQGIGVNLAGSGFQPPPGTVSQGATDFPAMGFALYKSGVAGAVNFTGVSLNTNGSHTAQASDITAIKLARDLNTNLVIDPGEVIATVTTIGFPLTLSGFASVQAIPNGPPAFNLYIIGVDVSASAVPGRVISLRIAQNADVIVNPTTNVIGAPVNGSDQTIVAATTAEIDVQRPAGTSIPNGNTDTLGNVQAGTPTNFIYTIANTGTGPLSLTGAPLVNIPAISLVNCTASVTSPPSTPVSGPGTTTFTVEVTPSTAGQAFSFSFGIQNDDSNENPYIVNVQGNAVVAVPTINVSTNSLPLGTTTQGTAGTPATYTVSGTSLTANISINAPTNVEISDVGAGGPYSGSLSLTHTGGTVATTTIYARITAAAPAGSITGNITHTSTGATQQDVAVTGTVNAAPSPTINVSTNALNLGTTTQGTASTAVTYTVDGTNLTANISINAPANVEISSTAASGPFSANLTLTQTGGSVATTTIYARITAAAPAGSITGNITHTSTGATQQDVSVSGTVNAPGAPEMDVTRGATPITDGNPDALGTVPSGVAQTVTYTIANSGTATLNLTGMPNLVVVTPVMNVTSASVSVQPTNTVTAAGQTSFTVQYTVTTAGAFSFTISIANDDASENPYDWTVSGTGAANVPELDVSRGATPVLSSATDSIGNVPSGSATPVTYTLANTGTAVLNISAAGATAGTNCSVTVTTAAPATIAASATAPFTVSVTPLAPGAFDFTVTITNDDPSEGTYTFTVSGTATTGGGGGGGGGSDGGGCSTGETSAWWLAAAALGLFMAFGRRSAARR